MLKTLAATAAAAVLALSATAQPPAPTPANPATTKAKPPLTQDGGQPVGNNQVSRSAGVNGPLLLDNVHLIEKLARFDRERTPERVVHARGVAAHGEFVSYQNLSDLTKAKPFSAKDKKTPVFMRFSTVIHPSGSPEQLRDPRGFAVKFYTEDGNWDLVGNNLPVFFIRDAIKFPDFVHALKPNPINNQQEPERVFDFCAALPETTHMLTFLYSDQGTPASLRKMDGFGVHAFKMVNDKGDVTYVKFNWRCMQPLTRYTAAEAAIASAQNHSGLTEDLYNAIKAGDYPSWELCIQTMKPDQLDSFDFDPLDDTKIWPGIPEKKIGKLTLNRVPDNFFQWTEQSAFSPGMMIPGIEASEDRMLQGRMFSYGDTQRHRIGANYLQLPVNRPQTLVSTNNQNGQLNQGDSKSATNYEPSIVVGRRDEPAYEATKQKLAPQVTQRPIDKQQNFKQAGELYLSFTAKEKDNLVSNLSGDLNKVKTPAIKLRAIANFYQANTEYGTRLAKACHVDLEDVKKEVEQASKEVARK